ncbi:MAG: hypothetical protein Q9202_003629 [Teloschistes flavicans]
MDLLRKLQSHLGEVLANPAGISLDETLLEKFDGQVTGVQPAMLFFRSGLRSYRAPEANLSTDSIPEEERDALIHQLAQLLPNLQQDPTPVTNFIQLLIRPFSYTFSRVLDIQPAVDFHAGLKAPSSPINLVTLALLQKAKLSKSDADIVASKPEVVAALIELWLSTPDTAIARRAHDVFLGLLLAKDGNPPTMTASSNQNLMWRRVFRDKDLYGLIYQICSLDTSVQAGQLSKRDKTVAQGRLLDLVVKIDCDAIRSTQIADVEKRYGVQGGGLLEFATTRMVDYEDDVLMHMTLVDFFAELLRPDHSMVQPFDISIGPPYSSTSLDFLVSTGLHSRTLSYYIDSSRHCSLDLTYLYSRSANYLATYCTYNPIHFLQSETVIKSTIARLSEVLENVSPGRWAQGQTPKHDLHVLASLPRLALLPTRTSDSPLFMLPVQPPSEDAIQSLATVFHGPSEQGQADRDGEASASRALYFLYLERNPNMWQHIVKAAETVALKEAALAAIALMKSIITSEWGPLPADDHETGFSLPTEAQLAESCHSPQRLPPSGTLAMLTPPALENVISYLLRPAQTFSNLVGGGKGDVESAAYRVAAAKFDVLVSLKPKLEEVAQQTGTLEDAVAVINKRLALGVLGGSGEPGSSVGTMEL